MYDSVINGKNILITGGTGSFGYQIFKELAVYKPKSVIIFSRDEDKQNTMKQEFQDQKISKITKFVIGDIRDALKIGAVEVVAKMFIYYFHERAWVQIPLGTIRKLIPSGNK